MADLGGVNDLSFIKIYKEVIGSHRDFLSLGVETRTRRFWLRANAAFGLVFVFFGRTLHPLGWNARSRKRRLFVRVIRTNRRIDQC